MEGCLFCKIIAKEIPAKVEYEDEEAISIQDVNPQAPVHLLILPKRHIESASALREPDLPTVARLIWTAKKLAEVKGIARDGYRLIFNSGSQGGQTVFHLHLHLIGGRRMSWPPG